MKTIVITASLAFDVPDSFDLDEHHDSLFLDLEYASISGAHGEIASAPSIEILQVREVVND